MKTIRYERYGGPDELFLATAPEPVPKSGQVLVRMKASSINAADYRMMRANPFLVRLMNGLFAPRKHRVLGSDVAGIVVSVGEGQMRWRVGDAVFGSCFSHMGAWAELVIVDANALEAIPEGVTFEEAAALPLAALTALDATRAIKPGDDVLVQGAGGGVGMFAVQIAVAMGARVTAVCGARSAEIVAQFGAARVIDYARCDFTKESARYDLILGVNGYHALSDYKRCLKPGGRYAMVGGDNTQIFQSLLFARIFFLGSGKAASIVAPPPTRIGEDLATLRALLTKKQLRPVIDRVFALDDAAEAVRYVEARKALGKVVLRAE